jgi:hypothetical protein
MDLEVVAKYFWDVDVSSIDLERHKNFIIRRIMQSGDLGSIRWLRTKFGDESLRDWIVGHNARGLSPRQIRYWALILDIDPLLADQWVIAALNSIWERRR